ncbi:hypothetical protein B5X24_HaOG209537 [Helicoverpa armigera]|uniref:Uncharacterized protein n=1 Tax=Helicoverpa armigera TaxID=29058 RepID=A0A2W1BI72_HELAM|nr:hypothetical protein B5X24_HaOG209537 [Helicoverpa armigera]
MGLYSLLFFSLIIILKVESIPVKFLQINKQETKDYEVFKDILIQNLIVTTDNLKLILNWERENSIYRIQNEEDINSELTYYNPDVQYKKVIKNVKKGNDDATTKKPINVYDFDISKYLTKRSPNEENKPSKNEIENQETAGKTKAIKTVNKREDNENSPQVLGEEFLLNYGNSNSLEMDNYSDTYHMVDKRQAASEDNAIGLPTGDGDTQMFMGTFQAVMRPMKLPSLG